MKCMLDVPLHEWLWRGDCTALVYIIGHLRISLVFLSAPRCPAEIFFFTKQISSNVRDCSLEVTQKEAVWMARSDENICCSIGLQWPNPHNKESLWFTHWEKMGKPANCQSTISSLLSHCFSFLGVTLAHRAAVTCLFHCTENRGEGAGG